MEVSMKLCNVVSLIFGAVITLILCLFCSVFAPDSIYRWCGITAIVMMIFAASLVNIPIQQVAVLKILGKRWNIAFYEGWCWIPWFMANIEVVNCQLGVVDVPLIKIFTKNNVEVGVNIWVYLKVVDPFIYLNLKNPEEMIRISAESKSNEATSEFVCDKTDKQCRNQEKILQEKITEKMANEEEKLGVGVSDIDIRPILPTDQFKQEYTEDFKKDLRTKRYAKDAKKISDATPGLKPSEIANTTQVIEGMAKKEISDKKNTLKLDVESDILGLIAEFLPKKKGNKK